MLADVLQEIERDATPDPAALVLRLATDYFDATGRGEGTVFTTRSANEIAARLDEPLPEDGRSLAEVVDRVRTEMIADANRLAHPMYMGHQVSFPLPTSVWIDSVIAALNQSVAVEEMSPTLTALETRVVRWMCDAVGFPERPAKPQRAVRRAGTASGYSYFPRSFKPFSPAAGARVPDCMRNDLRRSAPGALRAPSASATKRPLRCRFWFPL